MKTTWKTWAAAMMAVVGMIPLGCGSVVEIAAQPPGCPAAKPTSSSPCSEAASGCTYAEGPCTVELSCDPAIGAWQSATKSCSPVAKDCWSAQDGDVCAVVGDGCGESSGPCGGGFFNSCGEDHLWHSFASGGTGGGEDCCPLTGECPADQPSEGEPCDPCYGAPSCSYPSTCGGDYATCGQDGVWHISIGGCPPPPPPDLCTSLGTKGACEMDASCRWLTPGCGDTPVLSPGCFTINDCGPGTCGATELCQTFSYNPCFEKKCDACSAPASLCVWGF